MLGHLPRVLQTGHPRFYGIFFSALGPVQGHNFLHLLALWLDKKKLFSFLALTPNVKAL
jgi:hypothetical protein